MLHNPNIGTKSRHGQDRSANHRSARTTDKGLQNGGIYSLVSSYNAKNETRVKISFGWFDEDGTVLLRSADEDSYEARYGGYYENYIVPPFQAVITNLAT